MGDMIVSSVLSAAGHTFGVIPWQIWVGLALVGVIVIGLLRFLTDPHILIPIIAIAGFGIMVVSFRAYWIAEGVSRMQSRVDEAEARVAAYQRTNGMIQQCYARNFDARYLWDRTQGKCLSASGAIE